MPDRSSPRPRLIPSRRAYKSWVAAETLEDYALRFTPEGARRFGLAGVANTALGATAFMALEAIGGAITLAYGTRIALAAIAFSALVLFATALPITACAARRGIDIDLLTRGAGFGYLGSTVTSLIYASFTFLFFAIEASILADALHATLGIPLALGDVLASVSVVPIVMLGITAISRFQRLTQPVWVVLTTLPLLAVLARCDGALGVWLRFPGSAQGSAIASFGAAASVVIALVAQVGEQVDYLRFLPRPAEGRAWRWWAALLASGPGWILPGALKMTAGSLLATIALAAGAPPTRAAEPLTMYDTAFERLLPGAPGLAAAAALVLVATAQLKINVTNAYSGSIAWSNFFARLTRDYPGRVVWVGFNVAIALVLTELGIYRVLGPVLVLFSILACAWVGALFGDLAVARPLGIVRSRLDFRRAHLFDVNPVGVGAMAAATAAGLAARLGIAGMLVSAFAPFVALATGIALVPALAAATRGRTYLARRARPGTGLRRCVVCDGAYEAEDSAYCPAYRGAICSLCCTLDLRCADACRPHAHAGAQLARLAGRLAPPGIGRGRAGRIALRFGLRLGGATLLLGLLLVAILLATRTGGVTLETALFRAFVALSLAAGVVAALLTLVEESRSAAWEENRRQTASLEAEIRRREEAEKKLTRAREAAESANIAKTRFTVGVAHELRTPLNAVLGYAQLLEVERDLSPGRREKLRAIRLGAEHLARLIEGLLDISRIEAGRIELERREVALAPFLGQIADLVRLQAEARGLAFSYRLAPNLPGIVAIDETRLRQVLLNLLANAVKYTERGTVAFSVTRIGAVAEFAIADSGPGIAPADRARIFEPFERGATNVPGTGLGLTISRLLTEIMGGELTVDSELGRGSTFRVRLLLSARSGAAAAAPVAVAPRGYLGRRRTIAAADDDAAQRALLADVLEPLGFVLHAVADGASLLRLDAEARAAGRPLDALLLDVSMGGLAADAMDGWDTARRLRAQGCRAPIVMISAGPERRDATPPHDAFLGKPMRIDALRETLGRLLGLEWIHDGAEAEAEAGASAARAGDRAALARLLRRGDARAARGMLEAAPDPALAPVLAAVRGFRLEEAAALLDRLAAAEPPGNPRA